MNHSHTSLIVLNFLQQHLIPRGFRKLGPHSLLYEDGRDQIVVYVSLTGLTIIHDGENVCTNLQMIPIWEAIDTADDSSLDQLYLQPILHLF